MKTKFKVQLSLLKLDINNFALFFAVIMLLYPHESCWQAQYIDA